MNLTYSEDERQRIELDLLNAEITIRNLNVSEKEKARYSEAVAAVKEQYNGMLRRHRADLLKAMNSGAVN